MKAAELKEILMELSDDAEVNVSVRVGISQWVSASVTKVSTNKDGYVGGFCVAPAPRSGMTIQVTID